MRKTGPRRDLMERELLDRAAELFAERGFAATSLQDIADAARVGRTTLYHYFKSKNEFLTALVEDVTIQPSRKLHTARRRRDHTAQARLRDAVGILIASILERPLRFRVLVREEQSLPPTILRRHEKAKREVLEEIAAIITAGIDSGEFRVADARIAALAIIGMCTWSAWWFKPQAPRGADEVAAMITEQAVQSVSNGRTSSAKDAPEATFKSIRAGLSYLEHVFGQRR
jgi:AcrR family transcriptional regulator